MSSKIAEVFRWNCWKMISKELKEGDMTLKKIMKSQGKMPLHLIKNPPITVLILMVCLFPSASFSKKKSDRTWIRANLVAMCASAKKPAPNFYRLVCEGPFFYRFIIIQKEPPFWKWWLTSRVYIYIHIWIYDCYKLVCIWLRASHA